MPEAEVTITPELVGELVRTQHPDLADLPLRMFAHGWDNTLLRLGEELLVRLPRRAQAVQLLRHEQRWLPVLAQDLPAFRLPVPVRLGAPGSGYPWPWSVLPWVPGHPATALPRELRGGLAGPLARFCTGLHRPAPAEAPHNPVRGGPLRTRDAAVRERLATELLPRPRELAACWAEALTAPAWSGPPGWVHGDLHPANLVVGGTGLAAVVDFGDLCAGDPATDLATAWLTFDAPARRLFRRALDRSGRGPDAAAWARARGWALALGTALYTASDDAPHLRHLGAETLSEILADRPGTGR